MWWLMLVTPALERQRQQNQKFRVNDLQLHRKFRASLDNVRQSKRNPQKQTKIQLLQSHASSCQTLAGHLPWTEYYSILEVLGVSMTCKSLWPHIRGKRAHNK